MASRYINNFCFCSTIDELITLKKEEWLSAMIENYSFVTPYDLKEAQITAWKDCFHLLIPELKKTLQKDPSYGKIHIVFEYVLWDFDNENGVRPDVLLISENRIGVIEFKSGAMNEKNHLFINSQAKKYKHRLMKNHDRSRGKRVRVTACMTSMKDYYEIKDHVRCISPDHFEDVVPSLMGEHPKPLSDIYEWIESDYHY